MVSRCLVLTVLVACGPVKGNPPDTDGAPPGDSGPPDFQLAVVSSNPVVPVGGQAAIELAITRTGGFDDEITVTVTTPPSGLTVDPLTIPPGSSTAELVVGAAAPLAIGDTVSFTINAAAAGLEDKTAMITNADVTGRSGSFDVTFGPVGTGFNSISFGSDDNGEFEAFDVVNGNVFAIGSGVAGLGANRMVLAKFTATGAVDTTFNNGARVIRSYGGCSGDFSDGLAIGHQLDGRPIMIGYQAGCGITAFAASRISNTGGEGGVDFGTLTSPAGRTLIDLGQQEVATDGLVLPDGRIVFVGSIDGQFAVLVATATGSLDTTTFGGMGRVVETIGAASVAAAVALDSQDRLVVAGVTSNGTQNDIVLARYTLSGLDTTFGDNGKLVLSTPGSSETVIGMELLPNGSIVVGGSAEGSYQVRRFDATGSGLDPTFGTDGTAELAAAGAVKNMTVLPDGKVLMLGDEPNNGVMVRFKADGKVDPLFGTAGVQTFPFGDAHTVRALSVYDAHTVIVGGGNSGGTPGPGTSGVLARIWM